MIDERAQSNTKETAIIGPSRGGGGFLNDSTAETRPNPLAPGPAVFEDCSREWRRKRQGQGRRWYQLRERKRGARSGPITEAKAVGTAWEGTENGRSRAATGQLAGRFPRFGCRRQARAHG